VSTYVIGDIQGCHGAFLELLDYLAFDPARDRIWITGDLVNRGEDSLAVLRWCREHDHCTVAVLGNHDLHLLAVAEGFVPPHRKDTLDMILGAPDRDDLLAWLRHRPMLHRRGPWLMVHAGLPPQWTSDQAALHAAELEHALRGPKWRNFLKRMYGNEPRAWHPGLDGQERLRYIANVLTRSRYLHPDGSLGIPAQAGTGPDAGGAHALVRLPRPPRHRRPHPVRPLVHPGLAAAGGCGRPGHGLPVGAGP
jgi:bis(5'-nucleosyl)-tetraphosphatase (symmetrical)